MRKTRKLTALLLTALMIISIITPMPLAANAATALQWPVPGHFALSRGYSSSHGAMDINDSSIKGANIVAAMGGTIVRISNCTVQHYGEDCSCGGTGTGVVIKGTDNRYYSYAHMMAGSIPSSFVVNKTKVSAGDFLGRVGTTGNSSGPHLHFSIATGKNYLDNRIDPEYETYTNVGTTAFTFSKLSSKMSVSNTDAVIAVSLSKPANNRLVSYGATVYDNNGIALGSTSATSSGQKGVSTVSLWWTVSSSMGITLSPGRTYQFAFWANVSGVTLTSPKYSFTTTGTSDSPYTISYNANGGTGAPANQTVYFNGTLHIPAATPTREGYTFLGWYAQRNGDQTWYSAGNGWHTDAQLTASGYTKRLYPTDTDFIINNSWLSGCMDTTGFTFYAVWEKNAVSTYTVSYNANGGTGAPASQTKTHDVSLTLSSTTPTRSGYTFLGWATSAGATSAAYQPGAAFTANANTTLYAVWEKNEVTLSSIAIESLPVKTTYQIGDALDTSGLKLKLTYSDATTQSVTTGFTTTGYNSESAGTKTVTVSYGGKTTSFTVTVAEPVTGPKYVVADAIGAAGATVEIYVSIANNPGIISLRNTISYDTSVLELIAVQDCELLAGYTTPSTTVSSPYTLRWADSLATENNVSIGQIVKLTFRINDDAQTGNYEISVAPVEARNINGDKITFTGASATVKVTDCIVGDIDGDGEVSDWDAIVLNRYLAGWNVSLELAAADTDGDGEVSDWDAIVLERYLAGWNINLGS